MRLQQCVRNCYEVLFDCASVGWLYRVFVDKGSNYIQRKAKDEYVRAKKIQNIEVRTRWGHQYLSKAEKGIVIVRGRDMPQVNFFRFFQEREICCVCQHILVQVYEILVSNIFKPHPVDVSLFYPKIVRYHLSQFSETWL